MHLSKSYTTITYERNNKKKGKKKKKGGGGCWETIPNKKRGN